MSPIHTETYEALTLEQLKLWRRGRNQTLLTFAGGLWPKTSKVSFSQTNHTANKQGRQKKPVKVLLNFTYLHKSSKEKNWRQF